MTDDDGAQATINMQDAETYRAQIAEREAELEAERVSEESDAASRNARYDEMNREWESRHPPKAPEPAEVLPPIKCEEFPQVDADRDARREMYNGYADSSQQSFPPGTKPAKLKVLKEASRSEMYDASLSDWEIANTLKPITITKGKSEKRAGTISINPSADVGTSYKLSEDSPKPISTLFASPGTYVTSSPERDGGSYAYASMPFSGMGSDEVGGLDVSGYSGFNPFRLNPSKPDMAQYRKSIVVRKKETSPEWSALRMTERPKKSMLGGTLITTPTGVGKEAFGLGGGSDINIPWWGSVKSPEQIRNEKVAKRFDANKAEQDRLASVASASKAEREAKIKAIRNGEVKNPKRDVYLPGNPNQNIFAGLGISKEGNALGLDKYKDKVSNAPLTSKEKHKKEKEDEKLAHLVIEGFTPELQAMLEKQQREGTKKVIKAGAIATVKEKPEPKRDVFGLTEKEASERKYKSPWFQKHGQSGVGTTFRVYQLHKKDVEEAEKANHPKQKLEPKRNEYGQTEKEAKDARTEMFKSPFYLGGGRAATPLAIAHLTKQRKEEQEKANRKVLQKQKEEDEINMIMFSPFYAAGGRIATPENIAKADKEREKKVMEEFRADWAINASKSDLEWDFEREKYYKESTPLKLFTDIFRKKDKPWREQYKPQQPEPETFGGQMKKRFKDSVRAEVHKPIDDLVAGRNARKEMLNSRGFFYGGGLQPVVDKGHPEGRFPRVSGNPRVVPNPIVHSELVFWGRPLGLPRPLKAKTRGGRRKERAAQKKRDARRQPQGFFDVLFM